MPGLNLNESDMFYLAVDVEEGVKNVLNVLSLFPHCLTEWVPSLNLNDSDVSYLAKDVLKMS